MYLVVLWADAEILNKIQHTTVSSLKILTNVHSIIFLWQLMLRDVWFMF